MVNWSGLTEETGAETPLIVAETPAVVRLTGKPLAFPLAGARPDPVTLSSIPGAYAADAEAIFAAPETLTAGEPPTTSTTGICEYEGVAPGDTTVTVAL